LPWTIKETAHGCIGAKKWVEEGIEKGMVQDAREMRNGK